MAKLGAQLSQQQQTPIRATRKERVAFQQKSKRDLQKFQSNKSRAEELQRGEFSNLKTVAEYRQKYNALSPDLQKFFSTPDQVEADRSSRISENKIKIEEKIKEVQQKAQEKKQYYKKQEDYYEDKAREEQSKGNDKRADRYYEKAQEYDDKDEEYEQYYKGIIEGLKEGQGKLNKNQDLDFQSIYSYAKDVGRYERDRQEARNQNQEQSNIQKRKISDLEEAGYTPQIIQKFQNGNPQSVGLAYYSKEKGDFVNVGSIGVDPKVDVSKLQRVGYSDPQQNIVSFGGKQFQFKSGVGIYKDKGGEIVTPYARTGMTEQDLIKQSQDQAYQDWQKKNPAKIDVAFKEIPKSDMPFGYGGQQTISTEERSVLIPEQDYYLRDDKVSPLGFAWGKAKQGFNWADERVRWDFSVSGTPSFPKVSLISFGKEDQAKENIFDITQSKLDKVSQDIETDVIGEAKIEDFKGSLEEKYTGQFQTTFEQKYMKDLIYNETTFEKASAEFEKSDEAKIIQKKYEEEFGEGYKELQTDIAFVKGTVAGVKQTGIGFQKFSVGAFASPLKTATTVGAVYGGVRVLGAIPPAISYTATAGLGAYGTYKFIDPESTYLERGSGLVTATISGATLGYAGIRYLKSPVIKTKIIKPPKPDFSKPITIGKDVKIITDQAKVNKILFQSQKLSRVGVAGRRTIVSTKGRVLSNKLWREIGVPDKFTTFESNAIYRGVPALQPAQYQKITSFRGTTIVKTAPSGYEKATKLLKSYGYTNPQAKAVLRYTAPRIYEQYLDKGILTVSKGKAVGEFEYLTKQPVVNVDKSLKIKTRGGRTFKDVYDVERKLIDLKGSNVVASKETRIGMTLDKKGRVAEFKTYDYTEGYDTGKILFQNEQYKDILSASVKTKVFPADKIININAQQTRLFNKIIDLRTLKGFSKPANIKKTPFTFDKIDDVATGSGTKASDFKKVVDKLDDIGSGTKAQSQYYGTGLYERTDAVSGSKLQQQLLKSATAPPQVKVNQIKNLIQFKDLSLANLQFGQLGALKSATGLKSDVKLKASLDVKNNLKINLKEDLAIKTAQVPQLKTAPSLKSQLKSLLEIGVVAPTSPTPSFRTPKIPNIKTPFRPTPIIPFLKAKRSQGSRSGISKAVYDMAYLPDFTSRALGLAPETVSQKQAQKKLKKLLTGLEIRRGVKIKFALLS